ncbi:MAG: hypothetical protein O3C20_24385, partial [Verrucomicrobia bacterium]|nr:hypothetical protein [Verrucomicrobiota bacterium]
LIIGQLESAAKVRLQTVGFPDAPDRRLANPSRFSHGACAPVGGIGGLLLQGFPDDGRDLLRRKFLSATGTGGIFPQSVNTKPDKAFAPSCRELAGEAKFPGDLNVLHTLCSQEDNFRPLAKSDGDRGALGNLA